VRDRKLLVRLLELFYDCAFGGTLFYALRAYRVPEETPGMPNAESPILDGTEPGIWMGLLLMALFKLLQWLATSQSDGDER
jgi:hypothetical protein